jgi:hypothetical protein
VFNVSLQRGGYDCNSADINPRLAHLPTKHMAIAPQSPPVAKSFFMSVVGGGVGWCER